MTQTARDRWCINEVHAGAAIATAQAVGAAVLRPPVFEQITGWWFGT